MVEWLEDEYIRIADCPLCIVCAGRRIWEGWKVYDHPEDSELWRTRPCIICSGIGRMPFISPGR